MKTRQCIQSTQPHNWVLLTQDLLVAIGKGPFGPWHLLECLTSKRFVHTYLGTGENAGKFKTDWWNCFFLQNPYFYKNSLQVYRTKLDFRPWNFIKVPKFCFVFASSVGISSNKFNVVFCAKSAKMIRVLHNDKLSRQQIVEWSK